MRFARLIATLIALVASASVFLPAYRLEAALKRPISDRTSSPSNRRKQDQGTQDQDDDVVRVSTDLVVVNAIVIDKDGKFVPGLKRSDFQIFEDGAAQRISTFSAEETPFAAAILLDTSGSMESRLALGRGAAIHFLEGLRDQDVAAFYNFDTKVEQLQDFSP